MGKRLSHWEGEPLRVWESLWSVPRLEVYRSLPSTNDRARELARAGEPPFTTVLAEEQTAGRGRDGRRWVSPEGKGIWMSTLLRPRVLDALPLAPLLTGLAVCRAVETVLPEAAVRLKWPNDVHLGGRKVAGILCEAAGATVVAGIGVNVDQDAGAFPRELRGRAGSLRSVTGRAPRRSRLVGEILRSLVELMDRRGLRLEGVLGREVAGRDLLRGRQVEIDTGGLRPGLRGVARGITPSGRLRIETESGTEEVVAGSVRIVAAGVEGAVSRDSTDRTS